MGKVLKPFAITILSVLFLLAYTCLSVVPVNAATDLTSSWISSQSTLPNKIASHVAIGNGNRLDVIGGANSDDYSQVISASSSPNGSISNWINVGDIPTTLYYMASTTHGDFIYLLGGATFNGSQNNVNTVYSGRLESDGSVDSWQVQASLPEALAMGSVAVVGDRIYFSGGFGNNGVSNKIFSAAINSDGSLGSWSQAGVMPEERYGFGMVEYGGNLIILGGSSNSSILSTVYKTTPSSGGNISSWQVGPSLPGAVYRGSFIRTGNIILSVGGADSTSTTDKVYFTTVHNDGSLDPWQLSNNHLPSPVHGGALGLVGNYLYLIGGYSNITGNFLNSVYYTKLNSGKILNVPLIKQTSSPWGAQAYDGASFWSPSDPNISSWGCALTSAVMVFKYYGINNLPGNIPLDPGTLNTWLISQPDGYIANGLVNWLALSRLSKISKPNNSYSFDALEYTRFGGINISQLTGDIQNSQPDILEEPGHFIVGTGTDGSGGFLINDPYYSKTSLSNYSNTFLSLGNFSPSHTNLSYIMLTSDSGVNIDVKNSQNNATGSAFIQQSLDKDGGNSKSGSSLTVYYLQKPTSGNYSVSVSSSVNKKYVLKLYLYDKDGNYKTGTAAGIIGPSDKDSYLIMVSMDNSQTDSIIQEVTFDTFLSDINSLYRSGDIKLMNYSSLIIEANLAKNVFNTKFGKVISIATLKAAQQEITSQKGRGITVDAFNILNSDIQSLMATVLSH